MTIALTRGETGKIVQLVGEEGPPASLVPAYSARRPFNADSSALWMRRSPRGRSTSPG